VSETGESICWGFEERSSKQSFANSVHIPRRSYGCRFSAVDQGLCTWLLSWPLLQALQESWHTCFVSLRHAVTQKHYVPTSDCLLVPWLLC
jgi:hypothetical protein